MSEHIRILQCFICKSMEELPDFAGLPDDDVLLQYVDEKHGGQTEQPHHRALHRIDKEHWDNRTIRKQVVAEMWKSTKGFVPEYYATRSTLLEDAAKCFTKHKRGVPCLDYQDPSKRLGNPAARDRLALSKETRRDLRGGGPKVFLCNFCFHGDTEVVTRAGITRIADMVGKPTQLLVPIPDPHGGYATSRGQFQEHEVRYFGQQELWRVTLARGSRGPSKEILATAEHRWFVLHGKQGYAEVTTSTLTPGARLQGLKATSPGGKMKAVSFAVAQGFVFGDGTHNADDQRPVSVVFYTDAKAVAMAPYFTSCEIRDVRVNGGEHPMAPSLPRYWKSLPPLEESRSFLLSWLSGYFAADGTVDANGSASLSSAVEANLQFVRSLAAVCGVSTGLIRARRRTGFGHESDLFQLTVNARDLPDWFWHLPAHRLRVATREAVPARDRGWRVTAVENTGLVDDVYCAVVPGIGAFALADDIKTGNCPVQSIVDQKKRAMGMADAN